MDRQRVHSSVIASVGHDPDTRTLEVKFLSGRVYTYFDVPRAVFQELLGADSVGKYFNEQIRGHFREARVREPRRP